MSVARFDDDRHLKLGRKTAMLTQCQQYVQLWSNRNDALDNMLLVSLRCALKIVDVSL
jgi:hypothetical protein